MIKFLNKKKKDNKGFSLVELVIVIAILAILVGILAPQYTKYVEKSRKAADASNMDEMVKVLKVYAADPANELPAGDYRIILGKSRTWLQKNGTTLNDNDSLCKVMEETIPNWKETKEKSKKWGLSGANQSIRATVTVNEEGGTSVKYTTEDDESDSNKFAKYMTTGEAGTKAATGNQN